MEALVTQIKAYCAKKPEKWRSIVGPANFTMELHYFKQPHPKYIFRFVDRVALSGTDNQGRSIMHITAFFGEPAIFQLFVDMFNTLYSGVETSHNSRIPRGLDKNCKHVLNYAAVGRVAVENVSELVNVLWAWDPIGCDGLLKDKQRLEELLHDAVHSENYAFYLEITKRAKRSYANTALATMIEPHSEMTEDEEANVRHLDQTFNSHNSFRESKFPQSSTWSIPSLTRMCLSIIKLQVIASPVFRKKVRATLPSDLIQLFVDCLPLDQFSPRLLDFFSSCNGVTVDAKRLYWSLYMQERNFREMCDDKYRFYVYKRFTNLISVYDNLAKFKHPPKDRYDDPKEVKRIFDNYRPYDGCPVVPFDNFKQSFDKFTHNLFEGYDWANTVVIGGAVIGSLMRPTNGRNPFHNSDIDVCFYNLGRAGFIEKMKSFIQHVQNKFGYVLVLSTYESIVLCCHAPVRRIQIMKGMWESIEKILMHVDIDCTGAGFNGTHVLTTPRAVLALNRCWSVVTNVHYTVRGQIVYEHRLVKYAHRGFTIVDFKFPMHLNVNEFLQPILDRYKGDNQLLPYQYHDRFGMPLILLAEALTTNPSNKINYDIWEYREDQKDLPVVSKAWPPQRIRGEIEAGKIVYHAYGRRQVIYQSKFTPVPKNPEIAVVFYSPGTDPERRHYIRDIHYGLPT